LTTLKKFLLIWLSLFAGSLSYGSEFLRFESLNSNDNLSQNTINVIYKDHLGFVWIGTDNGLNRFDGKTFKIFKKSPYGKNSIGANQITSIAEDSAGHLWIGTWQNGISVYFPEADSFFVYHHQKGKKESLQENAVAGLYFFNRSLLLAGYSDGSIDVINIRNGTIQHLFVSPSEKTYALFKTDFIKDRQGRVWTGTHMQGLLLLDVPNRKVQKISLPVSNYALSTLGKTVKQAEIIDMAVLDDHHLILATYGMGLLIFNTQNRQYRQIRLTNPQHNANLFNTTTSLEKQNDSIFWIGTMDKGLIRYDVKNNAKVYFNARNRNTNLKFNNISTLYKDDQGILWVGTKGMGIDLLSKQTSFFKTINEKNTYPRLHFKSVRTLFKKGPVMYVGGYQGLDKIDLRHNTCTAILSHVVPYHITALPGDTGHLWIAMEAGNRLLRLNTSHYKTEYIQPNTIKKIASTAWRPYFRIQTFGDSLLWLGGTNGRLLLFDYKNRKTIRAFSPATDKDFLTGNIRALCLTKDKRLWVGSSTGELLIMDPFHYRILHRFNNQENPKNNLNFNLVYSIMQTRNGKIWVCTDNGLYVYSDSTASFRGYFTTDGLKNDNVYAAVEDNKGGLWLSTNGGLSYLDPERKTFINYCIKDGLQGNEFNSNAWFSDSLTGFCVFGGIQGLTWFNYNNYVEDTINVKVLFTEVLLNYQPLKKAPSVTYRSSLNIPVKTLNVQIRFAGLDFLNPTKVQYRYKINNGKWVYIGNNDEITLGRLNYGKNILTVNASNTSGIWSTKEASLTLNYLRPFYLKSWFFVLVFSLGLLIVISWVNIRVYMLKKREKMLVARINVATDELLKTQKELKAQIAQKEMIEKQLRESNATKNKMFSIIAHDLTSPFNSLLGFIDLLKSDFDGLTHNEIKQYIDALHTNSTNLYNFVKNLLIWSRAQQKKIKPSPENLTLRHQVDNLMAVYHPMAVNKGVRLVNSVPADIRVFMDKNLLDTILRNLISNAVKFSFSGKKVEVSAREKGDRVETEVKDQGVGMDKNVVDTLFDPERKIKSEGTNHEKGTGLGLFIVREFVEKSGGTLRVESQPGVGTSFILTFPKGK
jgi:signal transduction histidine kinase/ligand-binding sensor domain-containing protein